MKGCEKNFMSSYHSSFTYLKKNSSGEGFAIVSFEPDSGFVDSYLGMEQITTDSYDGTKKHFYGSKYNTSATISITMVKYDGTDFSMDDNRRAFKWLTGCRNASWLDFYVDDQLVYSFYGSVTACRQQKIDARVIGIQIEFASIHPWAWSAPHSFDCYIGERMLGISNTGAVCKDENESVLGIDNNGVVFNDGVNYNKTFSITSGGIIYNDVHIELPPIDNQSDDLYSYTLLDVVYNNETASFVTIKNTTLDEETIISGMSDNEIVSIVSGKFITSDIPHKIFGDNFNFVWPRLCPGINNIVVDGNGKGSLHFTYRYPMKVGDCAVDVEKLNRNPYCEGDIFGGLGSIDGITTIVRKNIMLIDKRTNISYIVTVKDSYLYVTKSENSRSRDIAFINDENNMPYNLAANNDYIYFSDTPDLNTTKIRDRVILLDEVNGKLYELTNRTYEGNPYLYLSEL